MDEKSCPCLVAFQGFAWRNEFRVQSQRTGKTLVLNCNGKWDRFSPALAALIGKYHNAHYEDFPWSSHPKHPEMLSAKLLREIMALSREE
jgi:hypothetical protein